MVDTTENTEPVPDVDALFNELDQGFVEKLKDIKSELATIEAPPVLESFTLSAEYLKEGSEKSDGAEPDLIEIKTSEKSIDQVLHHAIGEGGFITALSLVFLRGIILPFNILWALAIHLRQEKDKSKGEAFKLFMPIALEKVKLWTVELKALTQFFRGIQYARLIAIIVLLVGIVSIVVDIKKNLKSADKAKDPFLSSYSTVADSVETIPEEDGKGESESVLQHPEFTIKLPRIISNLKAPDPRASPMISTELYIEASNQETAVELHDREREVRDAIERVFEESTFENLDTAAGKEDLKVRLRNSLNRILNRGRVKRLYFSALNIAP